MCADGDTVSGVLGPRTVLFSHHVPRDSQLWGAFTGPRARELCSSRRTGHRRWAARTGPPTPSLGPSTPTQPQAGGLSVHLHAEPVMTSSHPLFLPKVTAPKKTSRARCLTVLCSFPGPNSLESGPCRSHSHPHPGLSSPESVALLGLSGLLSGS